MRFQSIPFMRRCSAHVLFHCLNWLLMVLSAFVRFVPWSEWKVLTPGRRTQKQRIACRSESASRLNTISVWIARILIQVNSTIHTLWVALPFILQPIGPSRSTPVSWNAFPSEIRKRGSGAIFCVSGRPCLFLHSTQRWMTSLTAWRPCRIQTVCRRMESVVLGPA